MRRHGIATATFVGHSLGSVYLSWVAKLRPDLASSFVFIDPIVFLLHHVKVAHSFLYETPRGATAIVENYFVKSEQRIVSYFHREFFWYKNLLLADQLRGIPTAVVLSQEDSIVPVPAVADYLTRYLPPTPYPYPYPYPYRDRLPHAVRERLVIALGAGRRAPRRLPRQHGALRPGGARGARLALQPSPYPSPSPSP